LVNHYSEHLLGTLILFAHLQDFHSSLTPIAGFIMEGPGNSPTKPTKSHSLCMERLVREIKNTTPKPIAIHILLSQRRVEILKMSKENKSTKQMFRIMINQELML
jgi:hypothetical protein